MLRGVNAKATGSGNVKALSLGNRKAPSLEQDACHEFRTQVYMGKAGKTQVPNVAMEVYMSRVSNGVNVMFWV